MGTSVLDCDSTPGNVATPFHYDLIKARGLELYWTGYLSYLLFIVFFWLFILLVFLVPYWLWWDFSVVVGLFKVLDFSVLDEFKFTLKSFVASVLGW